MLLSILKKKELFLFFSYLSGKNCIFIAKYYPNKKKKQNSFSVFYNIDFFLFFFFLLRNINILLDKHFNTILNSSQKSIKFCLDKECKFSFWSTVLIGQRNNQLKQLNNLVKH